MKKMILEICANSVASCLQARAGGAERVELCAGIPEGGTTPSHGQITLARTIEGLKLHVIIRPRGGDFLYTEVEQQVMLEDIEMARKLNVDGVVFGALTANGDVDRRVTRKLIHASKGMSVTFHRAFDVCQDQRVALEELIDLGCNRVLTSGGASTAEAGASVIKTLVEQANGRIIILPGCGINEHNIRKIALETGVQEFHLSARSSILSGMNFRKENLSMGGVDSISEYERQETNAERVRKTLSALVGI